MFEEENVEKESKQKEQMQYVVILFLVGIGYYFFIYLSNKREEAKKEINKLFQQNPAITTSDLDSKLWKDKENWEEHLDNLYLTSQINLFVREMKGAIKEWKDNKENNSKQIREDAIDRIDKLLEEEEKTMPEIKKTIKDFTKRINKSPLDNISLIVDEANEFIVEGRCRRKRLYWKLPAHNWADRWLARNTQGFNNIWKQMTDMAESEPSYFDAKAMYKINFSPSLWNKLTDKQKQLAKKNGHDELTLKSEVYNYKFSPMIDNWYEKAKASPIRGEMDPDDLSNLDNNAIFYGAPRTGKSVIVEKLAYEADKYPLVVIQGSTLTPSKPQKDTGLDPLLKFFFTISSISYDLEDDYGFKREVDGEVKYILFIDEADQACTTNSLPPKDVSTQLTFLKECMGSDNKKEESKNLWIAATNHLDSINVAVYQSGRLSNPLCFSWTLGTFLYYATEAGISSDFPLHWNEITTLNAEDNQWVNRFNKIIFDKDFLPFWEKFANNEETKNQWPKIKKENATEETPTQPGIKWGEMFEFFWQLYDSKQLDDFNGKFERPREPKIEKVIVQVGSHIQEALDIRLKEIKDKVAEIKEEIADSQNDLTTTMDTALDKITTLLSAIAGNI